MNRSIAHHANKVKKYFCVLRFAPTANNVETMEMTKKTGNTGSKHIGEAIRALRKSKGLTLLELANAANTDAGNVSRLERGAQGHSEEMINSVSGALGVPVSKLYEMVETPQKAEEIAQNYDKQLAELKKVYLSLTGKKRRLALRLLQGLAEE
jgi:transcriptional regulator with XRE-family HTH domain